VNRARAKAGARPSRRRVAAAVALAAAGSPAVAAAQAASGRPPPQPAAAIAAPAPAPPRHRLLYRNTALLRLNPAAVFDELRLGYRRRLFAGEGPLARDTFAGVGLTAIASPAVAALAPSIELQPLSIFQLTASYYGVGYFGTFGHLQSFPSASAPHGDDEREARRGAAYATTAGQFVLQPLVQAKAGPLAARSATRFLYSLARLRGEDRVYYDPVYDVLLPRRGWAVANDTDLLAVTTWGLAAGVRYSVVHALYAAGDFAPGEARSAAAEPTVQRVGPVAAYTFYDRPGARFNAPTLLVLAQWWVDHAYRTGREVSRAVPYAIAAFSFSGDVL
jgi:hypothetical protein